MIVTKTTEMNIRMMHVRFVAGKFLDRINRIDRILAWRTGEAGGILGFATPRIEHTSSDIA